jgi:anti-sigma factor ChrR (cupin superfamily)
MAETSIGILISPDDSEWIETEGGNAMKILRVSEETGSWSAIFKAAKGTVNPPHVHLGPADFYMISGVMEYRGGVARTGDWIYEANGAEHESTNHPEETIYLANVHGPIAFYGDDGEVAYVQDWRAIKALQDAAKG